MSSLSSMGARWLALLTHSKKVLSSTLSGWSLHVLPESAWVLSGYSGLLPHSKDMRLGQLVSLNCGCKCKWLTVSTGDMSRACPVSWLHPRSSAHSQGLKLGDCNKAKKLSENAKAMCEKLKRIGSTAYQILLINRLWACVSTSIKTHVLAVCWSGILRCVLTQCQGWKTSAMILQL